MQNARSNAMQNAVLNAVQNAVQNVVQNVVQNAMQNVMTYSRSDCNVHVIKQLVTKIVTDIYYFLMS